MKSNYLECYRLVREHEGGYVNHPRDPGGATKWGVIQVNYDAYRRRKGLAPRSVKLLEETEAGEIYRTRYWATVAGDDLPAGVDYAVFDFGVNSGVSRSVKYLQREVGTPADGVCGDMTVDAVHRYVDRHGAEHLVRTLCTQRMAFLRRLQHWGTFGKGWTRRVMGRHDGFQADDKGVIDIGVMMARNESTAAVEPKPVPGKGRGRKSLVGLLVDLVARLFGGGDPVPQL